MKNKLNLLTVEKYTEAFASKICESYFANSEFIDGKQIMNLTSIQQVNLFIIKSLFEKWQLETKKLKSPYFNFEAPEVQIALKQFLNVLSQHIAVNRGAFEPILAKAAQETLFLAVEPHSFFSTCFRELPDFKLNIEELNNLSRFVQINQAIIPPLAERLAGNKYLFANQAISDLDEIIATTALEDSKQYLDMFSDILPVPTTLLTSPSLIVEPATTPSNNSFFDTINSNREQVSFEPIVIKKEHIVDETIEPPIIIPPVQESAVIPPIATIVEEDEDENYVEPTATFEPLKILSKEKTDLRLNDQLGADQKTLNDQVASGTSVMDLHKNKKIEEISHAITLNQQFLFTNNLFNHDSAAYNTAIQELGQSQNFSEAKELLLKKYVPKYLWDISSAEAEEFFDIIRRRFN